uniref:Uncharacterized protein n=1 Tax=Setaria viridis TaxID=4556 RepID=A0A4U6VF66_SETVI|nr:hypothetical protein SEVIR_3G317900v2 [Setaria viridis]
MQHRRRTSSALDPHSPMTTERVFAGKEPLKVEVHALQGLDEDDVEVVATINQHLGEEDSINAYKKGEGDTPNSPPNLPPKPLAPPSLSPSTARSVALTRSAALTCALPPPYPLLDAPFPIIKSPRSAPPPPKNRGVPEEEHEEEFDREPELEDQHREQELQEGFEDNKSNLTL